MTPIFIDFESWWSSTHSLTKMNPIEYVLHPETELQSVSVKVGLNGDTKVVFGEEEIKAYLRSLDWSDAIAVGHNMSGFDALILVWRCGIKPKMFGCTAAMARPKYAKTCGVSLKALSKEFGIGEKGSLEAVNTKGKKLADFTPWELQAMKEYNKLDTELCAKLFRHLAKITPQREMMHIDMTTWALVDPGFVVNTGAINQALAQVKEDKRRGLLALAQHLGMENFAAAALEGTPVEEQLRATLASTPKFKALLESLDVEVPLKPSPTNPGKWVPALAKTDEAFTKLLDHDNPIVVAATQCRLDVKSTILETRLQAFKSTAGLCGGKLPVPLKYSGADTTGRWSGELYNCFTGDVEVLTRSGWVRFDAWDGSSPIMQWWPDGRATFEESPGYLRKPHEGDVVDVRGVLLDATMTPDHRLVSVRGHRLVERTAGWLAASSGLDGIPTAGTWPGEATSVFTPDEVRLLVAIAADGCVTPRKTMRPTVQIGLRKARKVERLHALLKAVGCQYTVREHPPQVGHSGDHPTTYFFLKDCPYSKGFGPWILRLSREALDALVDELPHWDGWKHQKTGSDEFCTSDKEQAEWVATAWHLSGTPSTVRQYMGTRYQLHRRQSSLTSVSRSDVTVRSFYGDVFCASVESTYIFIRRHGKIAVVGQCQNLPRIKRDKATDEPLPIPSNALRLSLEAPPGHVIGVADQSGIELRVNHFLWKVEESMRMFSEDPLADLYRAFAAARYKIAAAEVSKDQRFLGKVAQLGLGFGAGPPTFRKVARLMGGIKLDEAEAAEVVYAWRDKYREIVDGWRAFQDALPAIEQGYERAIDPWGMVTTEKNAIRLPSGRRIHYPNLRRLRDEETGKWEWWYGEGRHKARIYAGKGVENCIAEGTLVLCERGWVPIEDVRADDLVHDGVEFVRHAGKVCKSVQACVNVDGVHMTPDHEVLTDDGWKAAGESPRPYRPNLRDVAGATPGRLQRTPHVMEVSVCLRRPGSEGRRGCDRGSKARRHAELRLLDCGVDATEKLDAWNEQTPSVCGLPIHAGAVYTYEPSRVEKLRGSWHHRVRALVRFLRGILGGHGHDVLARTGTGSNRQRRPILTGELSVDVSTRQCDEQTRGYQSCRCERDIQDHGHWRDDALQPAQGGVAAGQTDGTAVVHKPVWDILDCGPRHRFVVLGNEGPFVVHNCVQALARDSVADCALEFYNRTGYRWKNMVHDELIYIWPEDKAPELLATLQSIMRAPPRWWPELVVWSEGDIAPSYGLAK